ncbi:hypothetical protein JDV02_004090 [Purpureocillium takamizusanense]|uniref:Uncharacterized protein n=1 Tax=Purpureocillium takamizusanense TaxID=2060973 RepID=A0A9Q8QDQ3_9HYPO|nr:uncharacterized protein JDV02_004090 [Purpureocillium takamizusanense]UNI17770.1 hypothetical protein JDV02_004090 [Purpureocillium takamizusanense]
MPWGSKITDTAKVSYKGRMMFLAKVDKILHVLQRLRRRAIDHATCDDIGLLAAAITLPEPTESELSDLEAHLPDDLSHALKPEGRENDTTWQAPVADNMDSRQTNWPTEASEQGWLTLEGTWLEALDTVPAIFDSFQQLAGIFNDAEHKGNLHLGERCGYMKLGREAECDRQAEISDSASPVSHQSSCNGRKPRNDDDRMNSYAQRHHVLLAPWSETSSGRMERYLNELEATGSSPVLDMPAIPVRDGDTAPKLGALLARLQRDIDDVARYRSSLSLTIRDARQSLKCNQSRWERGARMEAADVALVMKSRGLGSPLVESVAVDDPWLARADGDVDDWDSLPDVMPRRKLCGRASADVGGGRGLEAGADAELAENVRW